MTCSLEAAKSLFPSASLRSLRSLSKDAEVEDVRLIGAHRAYKDVQILSKVLDLMYRKADEHEGGLPNVLVAKSKNLPLWFA